MWNHLKPPARILTQDFYHHEPPTCDHHTFNLHYEPPIRKMISAYPIPKTIATSRVKILKIDLEHHLAQHPRC